MRQKRYLYMKNLTASLLFGNRVILIGVLSTVLFIALSSNFHFKFQSSLTSVERYISEAVSDGSEAAEIFTWFMLLPISHYLTSLLYKLISTYVLQSLLGESFRHCLREYISVAHDEFHHLGSGQIHSLIERRTTAILKFVEILFTDVFFSVFFTFWGLRYFFHCSKGVVVLTVVQIMMYAGMSWYGVCIRTHFRRKYNRSYNLASNKLYGILQQYDIIKSYNKEEQELDKYRESLDNVGRDSRNYGQVNGIIEFLQKSLFFLPNAFLVFNIMNGHMFSTMRAGDAYRNYTKFFSELRHRMMSLKENLFTMNENLTDIFDSRIEDAALDNENDGIPITAFKEIVFDNVSVRIGDMLVMRDVNVRIRNGEKIGITGKNGCGKSSFCRLLLRFVDYQGRISVDGEELRNIRKASMRDLVSFVPQTHSLFDGTVLDNIGYANDLVDCSDVIEKCKYFNAHRMLSRLEDGYKTNVGENGKFLSGGQKQIVSFMRAMVKDSSIVLLDEPTSDLDASSKKELVQMIFEKMNDKTVLFVVHDHELLKGFDKILGFSNGTITVYDSFDEFVVDRSRY